MSGTYAPLGTGAGSIPGFESVMLGATFLSTWQLHPAPRGFRFRSRFGVPRANFHCRIQQVPITRRRLDKFRKRRERNKTDLRVGALSLNERQRRVFRGLNARGFDIGGAHAP